MNQVVIKYAKDKPIIFSSFHPDAAVLMRKLQTSYPVRFFPAELIQLNVVINIYIYRADGFKFFHLIYLGILDN